MKKQIICLLITLILIININPLATSNAKLKTNQKTKTDIINTFDNGWLEDRNGIKILHLNGSNYEMGYQHGILLKEDIIANYNTFYNYMVQKKFSYQQLVEKWNIMEPILPQCYKDEMQGIADATGLSYENISVYNIGFYLIVNCGSFAIWNSSTTDGTLLHARSHDFSIKLKDPQTGTYLVETQVIIVRKPQNQYASVSPTEAGFISVSDGFNEKQISAGMLSSWTNDETVQGISVGFRIRMVLDFASTINQAIDILTTNKTLGYNFITSDGKIPTAYAVETSANLSYAGTWNNPSESNRPFWIIKDTVRRSNMFINKTMAKTQRKIYNPNIFPLISILLKTNQMSGTVVTASGTWLHYMAISKGIQSEIGNLDLNKTMNVLRDIYLGKTDIRFKILQILGSYSTPYQWVMCPETGEFVLSFADRNNNAFQNPINYFNFYQLLNSTPA